MFILALFISFSTEIKKEISTPPHESCTEIESPTIAYQPFQKMPGIFFMFKDFPADYLSFVFSYRSTPFLLFLNSRATH